jgi:sialic acid synthase SpsE/protoporphyrinogen oxidase
MDKKKMIILGAGPTGLATAFALVNKGYTVNIYEGRNVVGGLGGSEEIDGMVFDYGPHIYHTHDESMKTFWRENFGDLLIEKEFFSKNHKDGVLYDYPLSYDNIEKFPKKIKDKVKKELSEINPENVMRAQNFKEVVTAIVGPTLQDIFFETYSKKLWGIPTTEMSAKWAPKRIEIRRNHKSFWYNQYSAAGKYGSGAIMNRIADIIQEKGSEIHLNSKVTGLKKKNGMIQSLEINKNKLVDTSNSIVISTLPITTTSDFLGYKSTLEFNAYILAYAIVSTDALLPKNVQSIYFAHDDNYFHRVTEQKKYSDIGYPEDKTLLCFELSYRVRPHLAEIDGEELAKICYEQLCDTGFGKKEDFIKGFKRTFPCINPIMRIGFEDELAKSNSVISKYKNLHTVGGSAEFSYGDMQVMFAKANDLVELLTSEHYNINRNLKVGAPFKFNELVKIGDYNVGGENPTLIIAEIGINHQGSSKMAMDLIKEAKISGCEYAKIQTYVADKRISARAKSAKYADKTLSMEETTHEMFQRLELDDKDHELLFNYSKKINMPLISTPFDERSVDLLMNFDIDAFKIASFDIVNLPLLKYVASKRKPIILSTGMCSMSEIEDALDTIATQENNNVILLHCVSSYPADPEDVNLKAINSMKAAFKVPVGYSDHTIGLVVPLAAIAMNADVLEKHFTLNINFEGSDHILSATPDEMKKIVDGRDIIYSAFGTGIKKPRAVENISVNLQRKSIFSSKSIKKSQKLSLDNITIKGPGHGLLPKYIDLILGKKVTKNIESDHPITWDDLLLE